MSSPLPLAGGIGGPDHVPHEIVDHARGTGQAEARLPALLLRLIVLRLAQTKPTRSTQSRSRRVLLLATSLASHLPLAALTEEMTQDLLT